ncbi:MAG: hypothetical protein ABSG83_19670 [Roseiarcus sp.]
MTRRKPASPRSARAGAPDRLDATPERLARAADAGQSAAIGPDRLRRIGDPFDILRVHRALAPHDARLNDLRWLAGEALRRLHQRACLDSLRAVAPERIGAGGFGPRQGLPTSEIALHARDKLRAAERLAGPAAWPIVRRIVIEGGGVRDCRAGIAEVTTPWRADAIVVDRLRVALDALGVLLGVTAGRR